ncbi:hypothetical protein SAMN04487770_13025 [Butyrivibrio sp. ob235]|uniref:glycosyltransferase n=1 Tax=Butyrivibrio sp. ob235 TaxID=1761780 RepID=UPI0008CE69C7|nr:hypothetical protein [Butyrivibrio sp. ob235]SEM24630.1 hypothetical protein SAMN04487770_13025 [Butyrivibrio sp. ob235]
MNEADLALKDKLEGFFLSDKVNILDMRRIGHGIVDGFYEGYDLVGIKKEIERGDIGKCARNGEINELFCAAFYQLMLLLEPDPGNIIRYLDFISKASLEIKIKYNLWSGCRGLMFLLPTTYSNESYKRYLDVYLELVDEYKHMLQIDDHPIPYGERNKNFVIFITSQFTDFAHGPTKSCFFRAKAIKKIDGKEVMIINTNDLLSSSAEIPLFWKNEHNSNSQLDEMDYITDEEVRLPFFQVQAGSSLDVNSMTVILETIKEMKPEYIVNIGGFNITASIANDMVSVLLVGMAPGQLQYDGTDYFTYSLGNLDEAIAYARYLGAKEDSLIPSVFTSDFKLQREHHTRQELGISENMTVACVVGSRLDVEIDEEFIDFICELEDIYILFIGRFSKYEYICEKNERFKEISKNTGFVSDTLSYLDLCDIYINPRRLGGGTSSVEAMSKRVVPVSMNFGDVAYNIGDEFILDDYDGMAERIGTLRDDKDYYNEMSEKAEKRAQYLCDTEHRFIETVHELERRIEMTE